MDWKTYIVKIIEVGAWPVVAIVAILIFKAPMSILIEKLKIAKIGQIEIECFNLTSDPEINIIISCLISSAHSFKWFRENTKFQYTDDKFNQIISSNSEQLKSVTIVMRDETGKLTENRPGMKLTEKARDELKKL